MKIFLAERVEKELKNMSFFVKLVYNKVMKRYIASKSNIMGGTPCIVGTRIPIAVVVQRLKEGHSVKEIQKGYPWVSLQTIEGAISELVDELSSSKDAPKILQAQAAAR